MSLLRMFWCHFKLKCWLYLYRLPPPFAEDGRGSSGIGRGKLIGLTKGLLLPAKAVGSIRSRPRFLVEMGRNIKYKVLIGTKQL